MRPSSGARLSEATSRPQGDITPPGRHRAPGATSRPPGVETRPRGLVVRMGASLTGALGSRLRARRQHVPNGRKEDTYCHSLIVSDAIWIDDRGPPAGPSPIARTTTVALAVLVTPNEASMILCQPCLRPRFATGFGPCDSRRQIGGLAVGLEGRARKRLGLPAWKGDGHGTENEPPST